MVSTEVYATTDELKAQPGITSTDDDTTITS